MQRYPCLPFVCSVLVFLSLALPSAAREPLHRPAEDWCDYNGWGEPTWSPDGTRIASIVWWIHVPSYFLEMGLEIWSPGGGSTGSCFLHFAQSRPAWSPDGSEIAFSQGGVLVAVPADSCTYPDFRTIVNAGSPIGEPAWSPVDGRIAFSSAGDLWVVPAAGGVAQLLVGDPGEDAQPAWSPDGASLAFVSNRLGSFHIYIAPAAGGEPRQLTTGTANDTWPTWSPDGRYIAFASDRASGTHVWSVPAAGGAPVQVTSGGDTETAPAWSPDGTRIAYLSSVGNCTGVGIEDDLRVGRVAPVDWSAVKSLFR